MGSLAISSPDIPALSTISDEFSADGHNRPPRIEFSGVPAEAVELALICHDPDAPQPHGFTHWTVYGIRPDAPTLDTAAEGVRVGPNGMGATEWFGPQPPIGHGRHHYYFWVYALDRPVEGAPSRRDFLEQYGDAVLEQARFVGVYRRD